MLRGQIVESTNVPHLRERLLLEGSGLTLDRTLALARQFEQTQKEVKQFHKYEEDFTAQEVAKRGFKQTANKQFRTGNRPSVPTSGTHCFRCGSADHLANSPLCRARNKKCLACNKIGHTRSVCRSSGRVRTLTSDRSTSGSTSQDDSRIVLELASPETRRKTEIYLTVNVEGTNVDFLLDTGSSVPIMSAAIYNKHFSGITLRPTSINLFDYSRSRIAIVGCFPASVTHKNRTVCVIFYVVSSGTTLLGLDALTALKLRIDGLHLTCSNTVSTQLPSVLASDFAHLFDGTLGIAKNYVHKVKVRSEVKPVTGKLRRLPLTVREQVSDELRRLEEQDIIEKITASEWVSPIVVVKKKDGSIRLCVDLREPNKAVIPDCFPLPHTDELLNALSGSTRFSKLDLASAYYQVPLHPESRDLTAFITHDGLYRFKRVCFGIASAPQAFQLVMSLLLQGCQGVLFYIDDIFVYGRTEQEHMDNLRAVLQRLSQEGLRLNHKCIFDVPELTFLGHTVSARGLSPLPSATEAIEKAPPPTDIKSPRSFLGLVSYYSKFIPHYAQVLEPLRKLLRSGESFSWTQEA
ncbi:uncharacterized protein K02A2.6-like [Ornithodoros turicata]|uniref:uncharacterized protein K02A2.6-like n=1 Tax=Ornithodoros turicata TaxID=34597 RepID=UPI003138D8CA